MFYCCYTPTVQLSAIYYRQHLQHRSNNAIFFFLFPSESLFDVGGLANASQDLATKSCIIFMCLQVRSALINIHYPDSRRLLVTLQKVVFFFFELGKNHFKHLQKTKQKPILEYPPALPVSH